MKNQVNALLTQFDALLAAVRGTRPVKRFSRILPRETMKSVPVVCIAAGLAAAIGVAGFAGWLFDLSVLRRVLPGAVEMRATTAISLALAGCALYLLANRPSPALEWLARTLGGVVCAVGLATLAEYAFGWRLGIEEWQLRGTGEFTAPLHMAPYSGCAFAGIGLALAALPRPGLRPIALTGAALAIVIGTVTLVGYLWNVGDLVTDRLLTPLAVHSAIAFILLGAGTARLVRKGVIRREGRPFSLVAVEQRVLAGFVGALILLTFSGGLVYRGTVEFVDSAQRISQTQEVRNVIRRLYADISDTGSAQRTYLITGQARHLDVYTDLAAKAMAGTKAIAPLVADNPDQSKNLAALSQLVEGVVGLLRNEIADFQQRGFASASGLVATDGSFQAMQEIFTLTDHMDTLEETRLAERAAVLASARESTLVWLVLTLLLAMVTFAVLYHGIAREIMARGRSEKALLEARVAADSANLAKGNFLATMSHEIRTPMNGVLGMLELLSLTALDREQRRALGMVRDSGKSLLRIIDDILEFSKMEAGKLSIRPEAASVAMVLEEVHDLYAANAISKGLQIRCKMDPLISPAVLVDALRLRQILNNFVSNALKFTSQGSIEISAELLGRAAGSEMIRFSVADSGIGISAQDQRRLFQPFAQAEEDIGRRITGGTGLGLTICRRLAELMDGSVDMTSVPGGGTTMTLTLSMQIADPADLPETDRENDHESFMTTVTMRRMAPSVRHAQAEGTLLLLVDDHPTNRTLLARQVNVLGYAGVTAENGVQALEMWKTGRFAAIISDCNMPEMDGYELARSIRKLEAANGGTRIPIIACTANALGGEAEACLAAGMDDLLVKPVELRDLLGKLQVWLPIPATETHAPVDFEVLAQISGGDSRVEREILAQFRQANEEDAAVLDEVVANSDLARIRHVAHRVRGASSMIGAMRLAGISAAIEQASRDRDLTTIEIGMDEFRQELVRLNTYFDAGHRT